MKKWRLLILLMGLALFVPGCGFADGGEDSTVVVIKATPTPEPTPTPAATPTPEATPTPAPVYEQTASGVNIEKKRRNLLRNSRCKSPCGLQYGSGLYPGCCSRYRA